MKEITKKINLTIPTELIGKWVLAETIGTHGSYEILAKEIFFDTEKLAEIFCKKNKIPLASQRILQLTDCGNGNIYPRWEKEIIIIVKN